MNVDKIKEMIQLAKAEGLSEFMLEEKEFKLSFSFLSSPINYQAAPVYKAPVTTSVQIMPAEEEGLHLIKSPFVGTYYASPAPSKPNYVKVGDVVKKGQPLCILEAMKIMNEIEADMAGEIVEIGIENESLVEFGQTLFKIRPKK
jgi:acetyl-CoA carboxylase biotin carboxyl carrier protein